MNPIPEEFKKVLKDLIEDLTVTFPEYTPLINKWWNSPEKFVHIINDEERINAFNKSEENNVKFIFNFCLKKLPPRFFDILYQNEDMFKEESEVETEFLPFLHFKNLWQCDISDKTRETIWKYLQLMLFSVVGSLENREAFGDTAKLFESINEDDFKTKLEETLGQMKDLFENSENTSSSGLDPNIPDAEKLHDHITGMLDGKLGKLAKEIAEETASEMNMDMDNASSMNDVFNKLLKNPTKLMGLVKNVGEKLESKIKSGEIKESEIMTEASEMMSKMKNMPGMENIEAMLSKMGIPGLGKNMKVDMNAMEAQLKKNTKLAEMKERIKKKAANKKNEQENNAVLSDSNVNNHPSLTDEQLISMFNEPEKDNKDKKKKKKTKK